MTCIQGDTIKTKFKYLKSENFDLRPLHTEIAICWYALDPVG